MIGQDRSRTKPVRRSGTHDRSVANPACDQDRQVHGFHQMHLRAEMAGFGRFSAASPTLVIETRKLDFELLNGSLPAGTEISPCWTSLRCTSWNLVGESPNWLPR